MADTKPEKADYILPKKPTEQEGGLICDPFVQAEVNEAGTPTALHFANTDRFNFAFDIVDELGRTKPDKLCMVVFEKPKSLTDAVFHYCPGCTHGIVHRLVAQAIDELGIEGRTIGIAPVGCSVLAYNYFTCDMIEASHGRAPAVATGVKRSLPDKIVFTYQGDGDLASIGMRCSSSVRPRPRLTRRSVSDRNVESAPCFVRLPTSSLSKMAQTGTLRLSCAARKPRSTPKAHSRSSSFGEARNSPSAPKNVPGWRL